jgi:diguanylate cyclase (GGDEF)-like protein
MNDRKRFQDRTRIIDFGSVDLKAAKAGAARAHLIVIRGHGTDLGQMLPIIGPTTIGRDRSCNLSLTDPRVSSHHARIKPQPPDSYVLSDLQSTNGTRVDGKPIIAAWNLRDGEKIYVGESILRFTEADAKELAYLREPVRQIGSDSLTGLDSKRRFDEALDNTFTSSRLIKSPLAMLMIDVDGVRIVNERHGYPFGAHCIKEVGRVIREQIGSSGRACRYGGDDFCVFIKGTDRHGAVEIAERLRKAVEEAAIQKEGIPLQPTVSVGVAVFPDDADWVLDLVAAADQALYRAKAAGKNRVATR